MRWAIRGLNFGRVKKCFSCPNRPDRLWGPISLLFDRYWDFFPGATEILSGKPGGILLKGILKNGKKFMDLLHLAEDG
jgi:hypothetical protein